ncbi:DnaJ family domain-containing protein [Ectobacillus panaciterrae]|uniref:DnaJ family domain-containing protein n=1 Tax=Ectobacillus panaciterrae TaxID=363872 RepID=UPI000427083F|nr:DnaJ family domain-containing protein [Ectobacillus panaciterrae]
MDVFFAIAEERIRQSVRNGDFDDLPGKGKPLQLEDLSGVPEELRMSYKILKNAGMIPEEIQLKKDMLTLEDLIACCKDEKERERLTEKLNEKTLRFQQLMEKRRMKGTSAFGMYREKLLRKIR